MAALDEVAPRQGLRGIGGHLWEQTVLPVTIAARHRDKVLLTPCNWGPIGIRRQVLVLHDIAPLVVPQFFSRRYVHLAEAILPTLARRVAAILTVSEGSKKDIVHRLGIPGDKVTVVGCGADPVSPGRPPSPGSPGYFLFVGAHDPRKNLAFLLKLWPEVWRRHGTALVVTSRTAAVHDRTVIDEDVPWLEVRHDPSDHELAGLYAGCRAVLQPSTYEGFGLPLLEGMGHGRPFVSSPVGAAFELRSGSSAVTELHAEAWHAEIDRLAAGPVTADRELLRHVTQYTWRATAEKVLDQVRAVA